MSPPSVPTELRPDTANERVRALYEAHAPTLLRRARRRHAGLAEDVVSETFAVAVRRAHDIPDGRELAWLYVVADYTLRNMLRGQGRADRLTAALTPLTPGASDPAAAPVIGEALSDLPDRQRLLLTKTAFEGYSAEEAAEQLGIPYGSARNALVSGRRKLAIGLAALGAAVLVSLFVRAAIPASPAGDRAPAEIRASIAEAGAIHDVAFVRRAGRTSAAGTRYERWSDPTGARQRVVLPDGREISTRAGETLQRAAARLATGSASPLELSRSARADLVALDAAAPPAIDDVLSDPRARRLRRPGPRIDGRETTVYSGRITTPGGVEQAVSTTIANEATASGPVLRVRAQRLHAGRSVGAPSIVEFAAWTPLPRGPQSDAALGASSERQEGAAELGGQGARKRTSAREPWVDGATVALASRATLGATAVGSAPREPSASEVRRARLASGPIVHLQQSVDLCNAGTACVSRGVFDVYLEQGGRRRGRMTQRKTEGASIRSERWIDGRHAFYYLSSSTGRIHGTVEVLPRPAGPETMFQWFGGWQQELIPQLLKFQGDPSAFAELRAGPTVDGRATVVFADTVTGMGRVRLPVEVSLDAETRLPLELTVTFGSALVPADQQQRAILRIKRFEQIAAGPHAALLRSHFPEAAVVSDHR